MSKAPTPIGSQGVTPEVVIAHAAQEIEDIEKIYIVAFTKRGHRLYCAGDLSSLALAQLLLQNLALDYVQDAFDREPSPHKPA